MKVGSSPTYSGYSSNKEQMYSFSQATSMISNESKNVFSALEFGSGYGSFVKHLALTYKCKKIDYLGVDKNRKCADAATLKYGESFINADFVDFSWDRQFDYGFCLGTLQGEGFTDVVDIMLSHVKKSVIFEVFLDHPFLECVNDEMQIHLLRKYNKLDGVRFTNRSLIWKVSK